MTHHVVTVSFRLGVIDCSCGAMISESDDPAGDRAEGLASAFREHRREAGAPRYHGELGYDHNGHQAHFSLESAATRKARFG